MLNLRPHRRLALLGRRRRPRPAAGAAGFIATRHSTPPSRCSGRFSSPACVAPRRRLSAMQQRHVACVGRRRRQAVRQTRPGVHPDVPSSRNTTACPSRLMHPCAAPVLVDDGASMMLASTIVPVRSRWPRDARCALISSNRPSPRPCFSNRCRSSGWWSRRAAPPSTAAPRNASPTPPRREGRVAQVGRTTARSEHAASPTAGTGADRAPPSHRTARSVAPALPGNQLVHLLKEQLTPRPALLQSCSSSAKLACAMARSSNPRLLRKLWHTLGLATISEILP